MTKTPVRYAMCLSHPFFLSRWLAPVWDDKVFWEVGREKRHHQDAGRGVTPQVMTQQGVARQEPAHQKTTWQKPGWQESAWQKPGWQESGWQKPAWQEPAQQESSRQEPAQQEAAWQKFVWQDEDRYGAGQSGWQEAVGQRLVWQKLARQKMGWQKLGWQATIYGQGEDGENACGEIILVGSPGGRLSLESLGGQPIIGLPHAIDGGGGRLPKDGFFHAGGQDCFEALKTVGALNTGAAGETGATGGAGGTAKTAGVGGAAKAGATLKMTETAKIAGAGAASETVKSGETLKMAETGEAEEAGEALEIAKNQGTVGVLALSLCGHGEPLQILGEWAGRVRFLYLVDWAMPERNLDYLCHCLPRVLAWFSGKKTRKCFQENMRHGPEGLVERFNASQGHVYLRRLHHKKYRWGSIIAVGYAVEQGSKAGSL